MSTADHTTTTPPRHPYRETCGGLLLFVLAGPVLLAAGARELGSWWVFSLSALSAVLSAAGAAAWVYSRPGRAA